MNSIIKNTIILTIITLVSGLLLGMVYGVTKEPIAQQKEETKQKAYSAVAETASSFSVLETDISDIKDVLEKNGVTGCDISEVVEAYDSDGKIAGYVIGVTTHEGYGGDIDVSVGVSLDGKVTGVEILSIGETAGLGMRAKEAGFRSQYVGKAAELFKVVKTGKAAENEIDALSGATITSRAMTNAVNAALCVFRQIGGK